MSKRDWLKHLGFITTAAIAASKIETMEQNNITTDDMNEAIAIFDGWVKRNPREFVKDGYMRYIWEFKYHERWDLLMPVWIKWRKTVPISSEAEEWTSSLSYYLLTSDEPNRFFERMYYAITWLNQQSTTNDK